MKNYFTYFFVATFLTLLCQSQKHIIGWEGIAGSESDCIQPTTEHHESIKKMAEDAISHFYNDLIPLNLTVFEQQHMFHSRWLYSEQMKAYTDQPGTKLGTNYHLTFEVSPPHLKQSKTQHHITIYDARDNKHLIKHSFKVLHSNENIEKESNDIDGIIYEQDLLPTLQSVESFRSSSSNNIPPSETTDMLKVLSYNIWNYNGEWEKRLDIIAKQILDLQPDVIGVQEVRFKNEKYHPKYYGTSGAPSSHQIVDLAKKLPGYQYVFQPGMTYLAGSNYHFSHVDEGVAIFSKLPILDTSFIRLSRNFSDRVDEHQRVCLRALVNTTNGAHINFFVTHMSLSDSARKRNAGELLTFMNQYRGAHIIAGDFNETPSNSQVVYHLIGKTDINGQTGDFKDIWLELHGDSPESESKGWTYTTLEESPKKRIDFILHRSQQIPLVDASSTVDINGNQHQRDLAHLEPTHVRVIENSLKMSEQPSDHRPLYAEYQVSFIKPDL